MKALVCFTNPSEAGNLSSDTNAEQTTFCNGREFNPPRPLQQKRDKLRGQSRVGGHGGGLHRILRQERATCQDLANALSSTSEFYAGLEQKVKLYISPRLGPFRTPALAL